MDAERKEYLRRSRVDPQIHELLDALDVAEAERDRLRAALEVLRARIDKMPNPHANPMRHYYNQMQVWKDDADRVLKRPECREVGDAD